MSNLELKGLKGLRSLGLLTNETEARVTFNDQLTNLLVDCLTPGKYQPRKHIEQQALEELADSIKTQNILQPLIVRRLQENKYEIIAGERRWRAAQIAGLTHVPVIVKDVEDSVAMAYALIENIQRENLNPIEEAIAFERFKNEFDMTHADIASTVGRSRTSITNSLRLLSLCDSVKQLLEQGKLDMGHARALLTLDPDKQAKIALEIVDKQLSVRGTERLVNSTRSEKLDENNNKRQIFEEQCNRLSRSLSQRLSTNVLVKLNNHGCGKIIIDVSSLDKLDAIMDGLNLVSA